MPKLVSKIKSLMTKTGNKVLKRKKHDPFNETVARDLQKSEFNLSKFDSKGKFTPPYQEILEQLTVENEQIFRAVVYNLALVAIGSPKYKKDILQHLEEYYSKNKRSKELQGYLAIKISKIKNS